VPSEIVVPFDVNVGVEFCDPNELRPDAGRLLQGDSMPSSILWICSSSEGVDRAGRIAAASRNDFSACSKF